MKGAVALGAAAVLVAARVVSPAEVGELWARTWPILAFLLAGSLLSGWCHEAGLFDRAAHLVTRAGRGRRPLLFVHCCLLAIVVTVALGLDTTAVLLTPVLLTLAAAVETDARPFAYVCVWLANTGSLLLPVSNLTNLLAQERLGLGASAYVRLSWAPSLAVVTVVVAYACLRWRRSLAGQYVVPEPPRHDDPVLVVAALVAVGILAVGVLAGLPAWCAAVAGVLVLGTVGSLRTRRLPTPRATAGHLPVDLAAFAFGLFVVVRGLVDLVPASATTEVLTWGPAPLAAASAVAANLVDNLPAYLAFERFADGPHELMAVLVGVGAGPLVLPWASLANLLWLDRCRAAGVAVRGRDLAREGWPVALLAVTAGVAALVWFR